MRWLEPRVVGTYELLFCSKRNAASVVVTCEIVGTLNHYGMVKKIFGTLHTEVQWGCKNFSIISGSLVLALSLVLVLSLVLTLEIQATW